MRVVLVVALFVTVSFSGCKRNDATRNHNGYSNKFAKLVKEGKTTREQEQKFISVNADMSYQVDRAVRGTKKADKTRAAALSGDAPGSVDLDK